MAAEAARTEAGGNLREEAAKAGGAAEGAEQRSTSRTNNRQLRRGPQVRARSGRAIRGSKTSNSKERLRIRLRRRLPGEEGGDGAAAGVKGAVEDEEGAEAAAEEAALAMVSGSYPP